MVQNPNQFAQTREVGQLDQQVVAGTTLNCQVADGQVTALVPGQAVRLEDSSFGVPKVLSLAADTDRTFGFVTYNLKDATFAAQQAVVIGIGGTVMIMKAGAAIARGAVLQYADATKKVITNAGVLPRIGWAYDKATADLQLIRVFITTPAFSLANLNLQDLLDVTITTPADTQVLKYNAGIWVNAADAT